MKVYADNGGRRTGQIIGDLALLVWVVGCLWAALTVHDRVMGLAGPGDRAEVASTNLADSLREAGGVVGRIPLVGDGASAPFDRGAEAADTLAGASRSQQEAVTAVAFWLGLAVAVVPTLLAAGYYLPGRIRFVRTATSSMRWLDQRGGLTDLDRPGLELLALRALAREPLHVVAGIHDDPVGAWRAGDREVVTALALLELRASGFEPVRRTGG